MLDNTPKRGKQRSKEPKERKEQSGRSSQGIEMESGRKKVRKRIQDRFATRRFRERQRCLKQCIETLSEEKGDLLEQYLQLEMQTRQMGLNAKRSELKIFRILSSEVAEHEIVIKDEDESKERERHSIPVGADSGRNNRRQGGHPLQASTLTTQNSLGQQIPPYPRPHLFSPSLRLGGTDSIAVATEAGCSTTNTNSLMFNDEISNPYRLSAHGNPYIQRLQEYYKTAFLQANIAGYNQQEQHLVNLHQGQLSWKSNTQSSDSNSILAPSSVPIEQPALAAGVGPGPGSTRETHLYEQPAYPLVRPECTLPVMVDLAPNERLSRMLDRLNEERKQAKQRRQNHHHHQEPKRNKI